MRRRAPDLLPLASMIALGGGTILFVAALWSALRLDPLPAVPDDRPNGELVLAGGARGMGSDSASSLVALASDPFSPDRRLPDEPSDESPARRDTVPVAPPDSVRLLGTVVRGSGGFAVCQLSGDAPRIVHLGERLGGLTLLSLGQGRAVFRAPNGKRLELSLSQPGT